MRKSLPEILVTNLVMTEFIDPQTFLWSSPLLPTSSSSSSSLTTATADTESAVVSSSSSNNNSTSGASSAKRMLNDEQINNNDSNTEDTTDYETHSSSMWPADDNLEPLVKAVVSRQLIMQSRLSLAQTHTTTATTNTGTNFTLPKLSREDPQFWNLYFGTYCICCCII